MRTAEQLENDRGVQAFTRAMRAATMHMADEEAIGHERRIQAFMRAERKGPFDQMGLLGRAIVAWELDVIPRLRAVRAALWRERDTVFKTLALIVAAIGLLLR